MPTDPTHVSIETLLNDRIVKGPAGRATDRQVSLAADTAVRVTPTAFASAMHIFNNTGETIYYGGSSIDNTKGVKFYNQSTLVINSPGSDFEIYFYQAGGAAVNLDIVEFY